MNDQPMSIRRPKLDDIPELVLLDREIFGEQCYNSVALRQFYDLAGHLLLVAVDVSGLVGYSLVLPSVVHGESWFMALGVRASHRRKAIGRSLAIAVLDQAKLVDINSVRLTVERDNIAAQKLYRGLGFISESDEEDYFGVGEDRIVMHSAAI